MREKIENLFRKLINNDSGDVNNSEKNQKKKIIMIVAGLFIGLLLLINLTGGGETETPQQANEKITGKFKLVDSDETAKTNWIGSASEDLDLSKRKIDSLTSANQKLSSELTEMKKVLGSLVDEKNKQEQEAKRASEKTEANKEVSVNGVNLPDLGNVDLYKDFPKPNENNNFGLKKGEIPEIVETTTEQYSTVDDALVYMKIAEKEKPKEVIKPKTLHIVPTGTITRAVLLNGVDAPTLAQAKTDPLPILMRVVDTSILPNAWQYDIKDCFIVGEGYGDLTSERAYIRTNNLSCMTNDGRHIDLEFKGAVSGEDGKIGLKGRVVTKQGALLARTLIAGFLQGVGESFGQQDTTTLVSGTGTTTVPLDQTASEAMQQGLFRGLSESAEKLADFYLKMADQISPVIEVSAGREISIITTEKIELKTLEEQIEETTSKEQNTKK